MTAELILLFGVSLACDVVGQFAFKQGADLIPVYDHAAAVAFVRGLFSNSWVLGGLAVYAIEFIIWVRILALAPLSVAFPVASINILGMVLAGRVLLGERVRLDQWFGAALVTLGVILVAQSF